MGISDDGSDTAHALRMCTTWHELMRFTNGVRPVGGDGLADRARIVGEDFDALDAHLLIATPRPSVVRS